METLQNNLKNKYSVYKSVKDKIITSPNNAINSINFNILTYEYSEQYIKELTTVLSISNSELQKPEGTNPILEQEFAKLKPIIESKIKELKQFSDINKPLSNKELEEYLSYNNRVLSIEQIFKHFKEINSEKTHSLMTNNKQLTEILSDNRVKLIRHDKWDKTPDL